MLLDLSAAHERLEQIDQELVATCGSMEEKHQQLQQEKAELEQTIQDLKNCLYGHRTERQEYSPEQRHLDFGEEEPVQVLPDTTEDEQFVAEHEEKKKKRRRKKKKQDGRFPEHFPRETHRIEPSLPDGVRVEDCELIGVDIVEMLEIERAKLWVRRLEYPKYKIPSQPEQNIVQAPRKPSLISGGSFGFSIGAEVLFSKFALHVPLYRQQDPFAGMGWAPSRSSLCQIVNNSAELLRALAMLEMQRVLAASTIHTDDTEVRLLTPGEGRGSRRGRLWIYLSDEAFSQYDVFAFTNSRARAGPDEFLRDFRGTICGDCYSGYVNIEQVTGGRIAFAACNAHARRYVFNAREQDPVLSSHILGLYHLLYDVEERGRRLDAVERLLLRRRESIPLMRQLEKVLWSAEAEELLPKSKLGQAVGYMRNHWEALSRFLSDGRVGFDNNPAERDLRRVAVGRRNWLFVGSEEGGERTAIILTVIASAHRHDLDVRVYLEDVLRRLAHGEDDLEQLLPDVWKAEHPEHVREFRATERQERGDERRYRRARQRIATAAEQE
jgi:transposase